MTNKAQYVLAYYRSLIEHWIKFDRRNSQVRVGDYEYEIGRYDLARIVNIDQTPLSFEYVSRKTCAYKGDKTS